MICHGVNSHGGQYAWTAEQLVKAGFAVYALDLRGRGKSEGERFYVENVADYVSDVSGVVKIAKSRDPGLPVFLLGHSAGGVVSSVYTLENRGHVRLRSQALLMTMFSGTKASDPITSTGLRRARSASSSCRRCPLELDQLPLTAQIERVAALAATEHARASLAISPWSNPAGRVCAPCRPAAHEAP